MSGPDSFGRRPGPDDGGGGRGSPPNREAAEAGDPLAQAALGRMYENGAGGVAQDYVQAHKWFNLAAAGFSPDNEIERGHAAEGRDRLTSRMTADQIAEAQRLARDWRPTRGKRAQGGGGLTYKVFVLLMLAVSFAASIATVPTIGLAPARSPSGHLDPGGQAFGYAIVPWVFAAVVAGFGFHDPRTSKTLRQKTLWACITFGLLWGLMASGLENQLSRMTVGAFNSGWAFAAAGLALAALVQAAGWLNPVSAAGRPARTRPTSPANAFVGVKAAIQRLKVRATPAPWPDPLVSGNGPLPEPFTEATGDPVVADKGEPTALRKPLTPTQWVAVAVGTAPVVLLFLWSFPPLWVRDVAVVGPLAAFVALWAVRRMEAKSRARPWIASAAVLTLITGLGMVALHLGEFHILNFSLDLVFATLAALAAGVAMVRVGRSRRTRIWPLVCLAAAIFAGAHAYGAWALVDEQFDASPAKLLRVDVQKLAISHSSRGMTERKVTLAPFGPLKWPYLAEVSAATFDKLRVGAPACVAVHAGALGAPWFEVSACRSVDPLVVESAAEVAWAKEHGFPILPGLRPPPVPSAPKTVALNDLIGLDFGAVRSRIADVPDAWPERGSLRMLSPNGQVVTFVGLGDLLASPAGAEEFERFQTHGDFIYPPPQSLECMEYLSRAGEPPTVNVQTLLMFVDDRLTGAYTPPPEPSMTIVPANFPRTPNQWSRYIKRPRPTPLIARPGDLPLDDGMGFLGRWTLKPLPVSARIGANCFVPTALAITRPVGRRPSPGFGYRLAQLYWLPWTLQIPAMNRERAAAQERGSALISSLHVGQMIADRPDAFAARQRGVQVNRGLDPDYVVLSVDMGGYPTQNLSNFKDTALIGVRGRRVEWISPSSYDLEGIVAANALCLDRKGVPGAIRPGCSDWGNFNPK